MSTLRSVRAVCNLSFDGYRRGEIVDADPVLCARYLANGWLSPCNEDGSRIIPLPELAMPSAPAVARGGIEYDTGESTERYEPGA